jgi:hypothetical protein
VTVCYCHDPSLFVGLGVYVFVWDFCHEQVRQRVLESPGALFSVISRGFEIITSLGLYWAAISYDCLVGSGEEMVPRRAEQLRTLLCDLGPSFIKAGQVMMNRGKASSCLFFSMVNMANLLICTFWKTVCVQQLYSFTTFCPVMECSSNQLQEASTLH